MRDCPHSIDCGRINDCTIKLPSDNDKGSASTTGEERLPVFAVYADLECMLKKMDKDPNASTYTFSTSGI